MCIWYMCVQSHHHKIGVEECDDTNRRLYCDSPLLVELVELIFQAHHAAEYSKNMLLMVVSCTGLSLPLHGRTTKDVNCDPSKPCTIHDFGCIGTLLTFSPIMQ